MFLQPPYAEDLKVEVLRLLDEGQSVVQVAKLFNLPHGLVYRWRRHRTALPNLAQDGRSHNAELKQEAFRQIAIGINIRRISRSLNITPTTLHKWKKEMIQMPVESKLSIHQSTEEPSETNLALDSASRDELINKIRQLEQDLGTLKKAMLVLLQVG